MTNRYVNPSLGTDSGNATSGGASAWATVNYALSTSSATVAGDTILLQTGNYDELIIPQKSGTAGNPITIQADSGASPVLRGASGLEGIISVSGGRQYLTFGAGLYLSYHWSAPGGNKKFPWIKISGTTTNHIIIKNLTIERPGWAVLNDLATSTWKEYGVMIDGAKNITVDSNIIRGVGIGVQPKNLCDDFTIINNDIGYVTYSCIVVGDSSGVERGGAIIGNLLHNAATEDGVQFMQDFDAVDDSIDISNVGTLVLFNQIYENGENGVDLKGVYRAVVEGNAFWGNYGSGTGLHPTTGNNTNSYGTAIRGNRTSTKRAIIRNNIIYNSAGGTWFFEEWKVYNNTFVYNKNTYAGPGTMTSEGKSSMVRCVSTGASAPRQGIKNNIEIGHESALQLFAGANQPGTEVDLDYNCYGTSKWVDLTNGNSYTTLTAWKNRLALNNWRYGKEAHSFVVTSHAAIGFVDVDGTTGHPTGVIGDHDFSLTSSSPCKGTGGPLTLTNGAGTNSTALVVDDSTWFSDIFGRTDVHVRDRIFFNGQERTITAVNDSTNTLTLNSAASWTDNSPVYYIRPGDLASTTPDIGAQNFSATGGGSPPPPPTPGGPGGRAVTRVALNTGTGNQTATFATPMSGTPTLWHFMYTLATTDDTPAAGQMIGEGWAWDNNGTIVQGAYAITSQDAQATSNTQRRTVTDGCIMEMLTSATTIDILATFVSGDAAGVTWNITNPPNAAYLVTVEAFAPTNAYFGAFDIQTVQDTSTTVTCGFQPNYWRVATVNRAIATSTSQYRLSVGIATRTGSTITQQCMAYNSKDNVSPTQVSAYLSNARIGAHIGDVGTILCSLLLEDVTSTTFKLTTKDGAHSETTPGGFVVAMKFDEDVYSGVVNAPTSTNSAYDYAIGFAPGSADVIATMLTATNTAATDGTAGAIGIGSWDGTNQYSIAGADKDNIATSDAQSQTDDRFINVDQHDGTAGLVAAVLGAVTTNLRLNFSGVTGSANRLILAAIGIPFVPTVTAAFSGTPLTSAIGSLTVTFTDASTADGTTITGWAWDFGDGGTSTSQNPTHAYTSAGSYTVTLAVDDGTYSDIEVKTDYVVITDPPAVVIPATSTVLGSAMIEPLQMASDVLGSAEVI